MSRFRADESLDSVESVPVGTLPARLGSCTNWQHSKPGSEYRRGRGYWVVPLVTMSYGGKSMICRHWTILLPGERETPNLMLPGSSPRSRNTSKPAERLLPCRPGAAAGRAPLLELAGMSGSVGRRQVQPHERSRR